MGMNQSDQQGIWSLSVKNYLTVYQFGSKENAYLIINVEFPSSTLCPLQLPDDERDSTGTVGEKLEMFYLKKKSPLLMTALLSPFNYESHALISHIKSKCSVAFVTVNLGCMKACSSAKFFLPLFVAIPSSRVGKKRSSEGDPRTLQQKTEWSSPISSRYLICQINPYVLVPEAEIPTGDSFSH